MHPDNIYYRLNENELLEAVDLLTGRVVAVQHAHHEFSLENKHQYSKVTTPDGKEIYISNDLTVKGGFPSSPRTYSRLHADLILQKIIKGRTLVRACEELQIDYTIVSTWRATNEEFKLRLEQAYIDRAERMHDDALQIADDSKDPKTRIEARKWSAEKFHPERFGQKTKISGDAKSPIAFTIVSGIPDADPIDITPGKKPEALTESEEATFAESVGQPAVGEGLQGKTAPFVVLDEMENYPPPEKDV